MTCDPLTCDWINERIAIKAESGVKGDVVGASIQETCRNCPLRGRKTAREIRQALSGHE